MEHDLPLYRSNIMLSPSFGASPPFLSHLGWRPERTGDVLVNKSTNKNAVVCVIGRILERRLDCGPTGNFVKGRFGGLETAKFHCLLEKPVGTPFADDFDKSISNLDKVQGIIASSANKTNFIVVDGQHKNLRFTKQIFEKRERALEDDGSPENAVDNETEQWPVPVDLRDDLDKIKRMYHAAPLRVFARNAFVEVLNVNDVIRGALVEMHFELYHYSIRAKNQGPQDSFNAHIQQILVLQPGKQRPITAYKRKNFATVPSVSAPCCSNITVSKMIRAQGAAMLSLPQLPPSPKRMVPVAKSMTHVTSTHPMKP